MSWLSNAFAVHDPPLEEREQKEEAALFQRIATIIVSRGLTTPAILFLEMHRPLSFVTGQMLHGLGPFSSIVADPRDVNILARSLCHRGGAERLVAAIEREAERTTS